MIKAKLTDRDGKPIVILGLSSGNWSELLKGRPIMVDLSELGATECKVVILGGESEQTIAQELSQHFEFPS